MSDMSLALNADINVCTSGTAIAVSAAYDITFIISNCTSFKLQGSIDGVVSYADLAGTSSTLGASGTLTLTTTYTLSMVRCRPGFLKPVFSGTNPSVVCVRRRLRQSPKIGLVRTTQNTITDPQYGTA